MPYIAIKHLHLALAGLSLLFFIVRGVWLMTNSSLLQARWARILPHLLYTLLLLAGGTLATLSGQWGQAWIWTKLALLACFVALGVFAFRQGSLPKSRRITLWGLSLLVFIMIFAVAAYHHARMAVLQSAPADTQAAPAAY